MIKKVIHTVNLKGSLRLTKIYFTIYKIYFDICKIKHIFS